MNKFGVDIGYTEGGVLIWGVFAPASDVRPGALEGTYAGATASDDCAGTLDVTTTGAVNADVPGDYTLTYTATDVAGNTIYLRGQVGQDLDTSESVGADDPAAQAEQAMSNIDRLLREAGSRLEEICKIVIYLTDTRYREQVYGVTGRWLKGVYPDSTGVVVSALARPEWLVEIDAIAVKA